MQERIASESLREKGVCVCIGSISVFTAEFYLVHLPICAISHQLNHLKNASGILQNKGKNRTVKIHAPKYEHMWGHKTHLDISEKNVRNFHQMFKKVF